MLSTSFDPLTESPVKIHDPNSNQEVTVWVCKYDIGSIHIPTSRFLFRSDYQLYVDATILLLNQQGKPPPKLILFCQSERLQLLNRLSVYYLLVKHNTLPPTGKFVWDKFCSEAYLMRQRTLEEIQDEVRDVTRELYQNYIETELTGPNARSVVHESFRTIFIGTTLKELDNFEHGGGIDRYIQLLNSSMVKRLVGLTANPTGICIQYIYIFVTCSKKSPCMFYQYWYKPIFEEMSVLNNLEYKKDIADWLTIFINCTCNSLETQISKLVTSIRDVLDCDWSVDDKNVYIRQFLFYLNLIILSCEKSLVEKYLDQIQQLLKYEHIAKYHKQYLGIVNGSIGEVFYDKPQVSFGTEFMKSVERSINSAIILIVEMDGKKKKLAIPRDCSDIFNILEEKLSLSSNAYDIEIFDDDCADWVNYDTAEHNLEEMKQPVQLKIKKKYSENVSGNMISEIDKYLVSKLLKTDTTPNVTNNTFIVEQSQRKKLILKYSNITGGTEEQQLELISSLEKVKEFSKPNLIHIIDIFRPERINNTRSSHVNHVAFTMTYYSQGSVASLVREKVNITPRLILSIMKYTLEALNSLEEAHFTYGNIKAENILVEHLDLPSNSIKIRISDWWKKEDAPSNQLHILGLLFLNLLSGQVQDMTTVESMNSQSIQDLIKQKHEKGSSTSLSITTEVTQFLLDKHPIYSSSSNNKNTARQCLKLLYKLVKDSQQQK